MLLLITYLKIIIIERNPGKDSAFNFYCDLEAELPYIYIQIYVCIYVCNSPLILPMFLIKCK